MAIDLTDIGIVERQKYEGIYTTMSKEGVKNSAPIGIVCKGQYQIPHVCSYGILFHPWYFPQNSFFFYNPLNDTVYVFNISSFYSKDHMMTGKT